MRIGDRYLPRPIIGALVINLAILAAHLINLDGALSGGRSFRFFHLNHEGNLPTWWMSVQLFAIALLLGIYASGASGAGRIAVWLAVALTAFLSFDEVAQVHELIAHELRHEALPVTGLWPIVLGGAVLGLLVVIYAVGRVTWQSDKVAGATLLVGAGLLVASAAGAELVINLLGPSTSDHQLPIVVEEFGEMCGGTLMLWGAYRYARAHLRGRDASIIADPTPR